MIKCYWDRQFQRNSVSISHHYHKNAAYSPSPSPEVWMTCANVSTWGRLARLNLGLISSHSETIQSYCIRLKRNFCTVTIILTPLQLLTGTETQNIQFSNYVKLGIHFKFIAVPNNALFKHRTLRVVQQLYTTVVTACYHGAKRWWNRTNRREKYIRS